MIHGEFFDLSGKVFFTDAVRIGKDSNEGEGHGCQQNKCGCHLFRAPYAIQGKWTAYPLEEEVTYIGCDTDGRMVKPMKHDTGNGVKLTWLNDSCYLFDGGTPSGTLLSGKSARSGALLREKDVICVWGSNVIFLGDCLLHAGR
jgi:hypothetical protein